jgi:hypothetical protein
VIADDSATDIGSGSLPACLQTFTRGNHEFHSQETDASLPI